ncbi:hypothetical protein Vafri_1000, partial [Volvox africanus]
MPLPVEVRLRNSDVGGVPLAVGEPSGEHDRKEPPPSLPPGLARPLPKGEPGGRVLGGKPRACPVAAPRLPLPSLPRLRPPVLAIGWRKDGVLKSCLPMPMSSRPSNPNSTGLAEGTKAGPLSGGVEWPWELACWNQTPVGWELRAGVDVPKATAVKPGAETSDDLSAIALAGRFWAVLDFCCCSNSTDWPLVHGGMSAATAVQGRTTARPHEGRRLMLSARESSIKLAAAPLEIRCRCSTASACFGGSDIAA